MENEMEFTKPAKILDGADMNQDIHQLIGYLWTIGGPKEVFATEHCIALAEEFLRKHRTEWRPIETAPKDGTLILGFEKNWLYRGLIWWEEKQSRWITQNEGWDHADTWVLWAPIPEHPKFFTSTSRNDEGSST
jgi:hypothetical protein